MKQALPNSTHCWFCRTQPVLKWNFFKNKCQVICPNCGCAGPRIEFRNDQYKMAMEAIMCWDELHLVE